MTQRDGETIVSTGDNGLAGMKNALTETEPFFGVLRVRGVDEHGSKRAKFVYVTYVGSGVVSDIDMKLKNHISYIFIGFSHPYVVLVLQR